LEQDCRIARYFISREIVFLEQDCRMARYFISREIVFLEQDCRMARLFDFKRDCFWNRIAGWQDYLISREIVFGTGLQDGKIIW
jgi:hypothetical protein